MNSTAEGILRSLKNVTKEVSLVATLLLPSSKTDGQTLTRLLKKLQKEKNALVKKLGKAKSDSK